MIMHKAISRHINRTPLVGIFSLIGLIVGVPAPALAHPPQKSELSAYILLDRTGSMQDQWAEALSSVNAYAKGLSEKDPYDPKDKPINADVTLAAFDSQGSLNFDLIRRNQPSNQWKIVTDKDVSPRGSTPLFDAIGRLVGLAEDDHPEKAILVIMTDGEENASREWRADDTKKALDRIKAKGWEVVFLGAEFARFDDAQALGMDQTKTMGVKRESLEGTMKDLAKKSRQYLSAPPAAPAPIIFDAEDRAKAKEEEIKPKP
jgi:hypothetical protein